MVEAQLAEEAVTYLKARKKEFLQRFASLDVHAPSDRPVTIFMAGSPGAGKTEVSKRLLKEFPGAVPPVRFDLDEIRAWLPGYNGANADTFQKAGTIGVNKLYDFVLEKKLSAILDGTFGYADAMGNVRRSLDHGRHVEIYYLYQDPCIAWNVTKQREAIEGRSVPRDVFIRTFFEAQENVRRAKGEFGDRIILNVMIRDFQTGSDDVRLGVDGLDGVSLVPYTAEDLTKLLPQEL